MDTRIIASSYLLSFKELKSSFKVYAGPGAGKTYFLVNNIKNILDTNNVYKNSKLKKVACITYTNAAADEIKNRLGNSYKSIFVDTIHAFIYENIVKPFMPLLIKHLNNDYGLELPIYMKLRAQQEGQSVLHGYDKEEILNAIGAVGKDYSRKKISSVDFDFEKGDILVSYHDDIDKAFHIPIKKYIWGTCNVLSHTDILHFGLYLVRKHRIIRYYLKAAFPFILIDEFQDTSPYQTALIKELSKHNIIFGVVGDVAQSIYSFQGAKTSDFEELAFADKVIDCYQIKGNRRSSINLVNFFNQLRRGDDLKQDSIREYGKDEGKEDIESIPITIIDKNSENGLTLLNSLIAEKVPILTRTWSQAFDYISDIDSEQIKLLKKINNTYFNTIEDLRNDIVSFKNIPWVKGVACVLKLHDAFLNNSFNYIVDAFLFIDNECKNQLIQYIKKSGNIRIIVSILSEVFSNINDNTLLIDVINGLNYKLKNEHNLSFLFSRDNTFIPFLDDYEFDHRNDYLSKLNYRTAEKLFVDVFSPNSKYMTIHQAKGREWDEVIVDLMPSKNMDKGKSLEKVFDTYSIKGVENEYQRIVYVACTRVKNHLYIIVRNNGELRSITLMCKQNGINYEIK